VRSVEELKRSVHEVLASATWAGADTARAAGRPVTATGTAALAPRQLADVLQARASCRDFRDRPIPWDVLKALARTAATSDAEVWGADEHADLYIGVIAGHVTEGRRGLYVQRGADLERVGDLDDEATVVRICPAQPHFGGSSALLIAVGDVARACRTAPTAGYFHLLLRAGGALHGAWLAAVAHGVAAGMFAEIDVAACRTLLRLGALERPLLALALGYREARGDAPRGST
jgi:hypothetical protein